MALLKYGSRGSEVRRLQEALNKAGYQLDTDGIYGEKTRSAVRKYQRANGLGVDGIVGDQTWGALNKASAPSTEPDKPATEPDAPSTGGETMTEPDDGKKDETQANQDALNAILSQKPAAYQSPYADKIKQLYDQIMGRKEFSYDFNADPIYQQYKDRYIQGGQRAMQDTMANAAALTGGYGNSYASTAGNLAYQQYLSGLNDVIPDLYGNAYNRYVQEGKDLYNLLETTQGLDEAAYGRYMDDYNKYLSDRDFEYARQQDDLAQKNYEWELALKTGNQVGADNSPAYATVLGNAKNLKSGKVLSYLQKMVDGGYITQAEADYIYAVELAGGVLSSGGSGGSGGKKSSGSSSSASSNGNSALNTDKITWKDYTDIVNTVNRIEGEKEATKVGNQLSKNYTITNKPGRYDTTKATEKRMKDNKSGGRKFGQISKK